MNSCSNSSNKAEKQIFEVETVLKYCSLETGCDLCLQQLSCKSTENLFKKMKLINTNLL